MHATRTLFAVIASALLVLACLTATAVAQEAEPTSEPSDAAPTSTASEPQTEMMPAMAVVVLPVTGSYDQHVAKIQELMVYIMPTGMARGGPFGVYFNSPHEVPEAELSWAVGVPVAAEATAEAPFERHDVPERQAATVTCTGPYETTDVCWGTLMEYVAAQGLQPSGPAEEYWLSDAEVTPADQIQTKLVLPVAAAE